MDVMQLILALTQLLPLIAEDYAAVTAALDAASAAVKKAQSDGGQIDPSDWSALESQLGHDLGALAAAARPA